VILIFIPGLIYIVWKGIKCVKSIVGLRKTCTESAGVLKLSSDPIKCIRGSESKIYKTTGTAFLKLFYIGFRL